jgi:hypothetical protein
MGNLIRDPARHWPRYACLGLPEENRRIPIDLLTERFDHDLTKHYIIDLQDLKELAREVEREILQDFRAKCSLN